MSKSSLLRSILVFSCSFFAIGLSAQTGVLRGRILTSDGKPVPGVTVASSNGKVTSTDENGLFLLRRLDTGKQVVTISSIGLATERKTVQITGGAADLLDVTLSQDARQLEEVIVTNQKIQNARTLNTAKSDIRNFDLPQSVGSVSAGVIRDQQATRVGDIVRNVSGVSLSQTRLGVNETYTARGYSIGINGGAGSVLKNGMITNTAGMPEASTLESVEVLKGSSAMLYGSVSGGLIVNLITKRPRFDFGGEVKMQAGTFSQYKPIIDVYGPISKSIAFRVVGTYENDRSFRDVVKTVRQYVNPSLLFKLGEKTTLLVQTEYLKAKLTPDFGIGMLDSGRILPTTIPLSRFHNVLWAYNNVTQQSAYTTLQHRFNDIWRLEWISSAQGTDLQSYGAGLPNTVSKSGDWNRTLARAHTHETNLGSQLNINGKVYTRKVLHQVLVGVDAMRVITKTDAFRITSNRVVVTTYDKINILDPSLYTRRNDVPDAALATVTTAPGNRIGFYAQDYVTLTPKLKLLAGIRWSYLETPRTNIFTTATNATTRGTGAPAFNRAWSPKLALVYQPIANTSVFASYANNFTINTGTDIFGQQLRPSIINQYELGVKNNLFGDRVSANFSIYRIINSNLAQQAEFRADGSSNTDANVKELKGETTSDGFEFDLNGNLTKTFYFIAGYGFNNMRFTRTSGAKGSNIEGEKVVNNPRHTANFSSFYTFDCSALKGLKVGAGVFYTGKRLGGYNNTIGQVQRGSRLIPLTGFTTIDLSAGYAFGKISLLAKLANAFDARNFLVHDNYSIAPITPRQLIGTVSYRF
jgi:iron complex outermembrane recepter protein